MVGRKFCIQKPCKQTECNHVGVERCFAVVLLETTGNQRIGKQKNLFKVLNNYDP